MEKFETTHPSLVVINLSEEEPRLLTRLMTMTDHDSDAKVWHLQSKYFTADIRVEVVPLTDNIFEVLRELKAECIVIYARSSEHLS